MRLTEITESAQEQTPRKQKVNLTSKHRLTWGGLLRVRAGLCWHFPASLMFIEETAKELRPPPGLQKQDASAGKPSEWRLQAPSWVRELWAEGLARGRPTQVSLACWPQGAAGGVGEGGAIP